MIVEDVLLVRGSVKWFDPVKGFGFVVADTGGPDILLHANVLRNFGQNSIADVESWTLNKDSKYFFYCQNESIDGIELD